MNVHLDMHDTSEEHFRLEEIDDSCIFEFFEIVPLVGDADGAYTGGVSRDCCIEVKQENWQAVKQEPVCRIIYMVYSVYYISAV